MDVTATFEAIQPILVSLYYIGRGLASSDYLTSRLPFYLKKGNRKSLVIEANGLEIELWK